MYPNACIKRIRTYSIKRVNKSLPDSPSESTTCKASRNTKDASLQGVGVIEILGGWWLAEKLDFLSVRLEHLVERKVGGDSSMWGRGATEHFMHTKVDARVRNNS
jgi:hypothetical protein